MAVNVTVESGKDMERVLANHAQARRATPVRRNARDRLKRLMSLLGGSEAPAEAAEEVFALLSLLGLEDEIRDEVMTSLDQTTELGIDFRDALPIIQAYSRAVTRVVEAESDLIRKHLRQSPDRDRASYLDRILTTLMPLGIRGFEVLHVSLLSAALRDELADDQLEEDDDASMCVALVDLCGSTAYLASANTDSAEQLVDTLFEAGQMSTLNRRVRVLKYVGDGMFLVGRDAADVVQAGFDALDHIGATLALPARAGIAYGPVLQRAGDYFGLAVNLAQYLTKVARPGTMLATGQAARALPRAQCGRRRSIRIGGLADRLDVVALRVPDQHALRLLDPR